MTVFLQYDTKTGEVKALLRPSEKKLEQLDFDTDKVVAFAKTLPLADGADAVLVVPDEADLPKDGDKPIPVHLLKVNAKNGVSVNG